MAEERSIAAHYDRSGRLSERILALAREHRADPQAPLEPADLARFDQFHVGGSRSANCWAAPGDGCSSWGPASPGLLAS